MTAPRSHPHPPAALLDAFDRQDGVALIALLDDCRACDAMPMVTDRQTLFAAMAAPEMGEAQAVFTCTVLRALGQAGMPQRWRTAVGSALLRASAPATGHGPGSPAPSVRLELRVPMFDGRLEPAELRSFALLMHASMQPDQWLALCRNGEYDHHVPTALACAQVDRTEHCQVQRNMTADGLDIDAPRAMIYNVECTMLQAAAAADRADTTSVLLGLGADPFVRLARSAAPPQDAFALARDDGVVRGVLATWRARRAMDTVLRPAAGQPHGSLP